MNQKSKASVLLLSLALSGNSLAACEGMTAHARVKATQLVERDFGPAIAKRCFQGIRQLNTLPVGLGNKPGSLHLLAFDPRVCPVSGIFSVIYAQDRGACVFVSATRGFDDRN